MIVKCHPNGQHLGMDREMVGVGIAKGLPKVLDFVVPFLCLVVLPRTRHEPHRYLFVSLPE